MSKLPSMHRCFRTWIVVSGLLLWSGCGGVESDAPQVPVPPQAAVNAEVSKVVLADYCVGVTPPEFKWLPLPDVVVDADGMGADPDASSLVDVGPEPAADALDGLDTADAVDTTDAGSAELPLPPMPSMDAQGFAPVDSDADAVSEGDVADDVDGLSQADVHEDTDSSACSQFPATCIGAAAPQWELFDFQPKSCGYQATYGLEQYKGQVTVVVLLAAW